MNNDELELLFRQRAEAIGFKGHEFQSILFTTVHGLIRIAGDVMVENGDADFFLRVKRGDATIKIMELALLTAQDIVTVQRADPVRAEHAVFGLAIPKTAIERSIAFKYIWNYIAHRGSGVVLRKPD